MESRARNVKLLVCDVDGVLTNGVVSVNGKGVESKGFHVLDGIAVHFLKLCGIRMGLLSGMKSEVLAQGAEKLGVSFYEDGVLHKKDRMLEILNSLSLRPEEFCYVGDDLIDIPCLLLSGFPVAVSNAHPEVKKVAAYITRAPGGEGAVRETAEVILKAQNRWKEVVERFNQ